MSDAELIARLRKYKDDLLSIAADRIEALVNEAVLSKAAYEGVSSLLLSVQQDCIKERQRPETPWMAVSVKAVAPLEDDIEEMIRQDLSHGAGTAQQIARSIGWRRR